MKLTDGQSSTSLAIPTGMYLSGFPPVNFDKNTAPDTFCQYVSESGVIAGPPIADTELSSKYVVAIDSKSDFGYESSSRKTRISPLAIFAAYPIPIHYDPDHSGQ